MFGTGITVWQPAVYGTGGFTPGSLYTAGQLGLWYDGSDMATLFQDSAGATPVTAVTQPVGRQLDKSGRGNHATQATASARPLLSARVNLLTKTEDFSDTVWAKVTGVTTTGSNTLNFPNVAGGERFEQFTPVLSMPIAAGVTATFSLLLSGTGTININIGFISGGNEVETTITLTATPTLYSVSATQIAATAVRMRGMIIWRAGNTATQVVANKAQIEFSAAFTRYQRVNTATDYDTVGFPQYLTYDGVDDSLSTGAITLGADMDCFIAVCRRSATGILAYTTAGSGVYLGAIDATAGVASAGAGTPTYFANGVAVPGGTATTRAQLAAAVPVNLWAVLEIRNANLSAWAAFATGAYTGFVIGEDIAGVVLAPAGDTTSRQKIRTYLGAKVGLTL